MQIYARTTTKKTIEQMTKRKKAEVKALPMSENI